MQLFICFGSLIIKTYSLSVKINEQQKRKVISGLKNCGDKKHSTHTSEEKISIQKFSTVDALKDEIRQKLTKHKSYNTESLELSSNGSYISIYFKPKE